MDECSMYWEWVGIAQQGAMPMLVPHSDGCLSIFWVKPSDERAAEMMFNEDANTRIIQQVCLAKREKRRRRFARPVAA